MLLDDILWAKVAEHLAGKPVKVYFREPIRPVLGVAFLDQDGAATVEIDDRLISGHLELFLHEVAHVKLGHLRARLTRSYKPGELVGTQAELRQLRIDGAGDEQEAWKLADSWLRYAEAHIEETDYFRRCYADFDGVRAALMALLEYR